jgi:uncharacterized protein
MVTEKNKAIIRTLNKGFEADDTNTILSCLADDICWDVAGAFTAVGKDEFRKQIHNDAFDGAPVISIKNEIAEADNVAVEGTVECKMKDGSTFRAFFHNTYHLENEKVKTMTSYLVPMTS